MKPISKKMVIGTLAAGVLFGGGLFTALHNNAYADSTTGSGSAAQTTPANPNGAAAPQDGGFHGKRGGGFGHGDFGGAKRGGGDLLQNAATAIGIDVSALQQELQGGKTIAQAAQDKGVSEDALLKKLADAESAEIDAAVTAGKLTQAQADEQKKGLSDHLKQAVEGTMPEGGPHGGGRGHGGHGGPGFGGIGDFGGQDLTKILGITQDELKAGFDAGKSLADIAQEKGITKDQLIAKLKDGLTDKLNQFVDRKHTAPKAGATAPAQGQASTQSAPQVQTGSAVQS